MHFFSCNIYNEILVAGFSTSPWANFFVTLKKEILNNVSKTNVLAARVELLQVSEVAGGFEFVTHLLSTATLLTYRYLAYSTAIPLLG